MHRIRLFPRNRFTYSLSCSNIGFMLRRRLFCAAAAFRFTSSVTAHQGVPQKRKLLSEYRPPVHTIEDVDLLFKLHLERTQVKTRLVVRRLVQSLPEGARFVELHGSKMLQPVNGSFRINGVRCAAGSIQPTASGGLLIALDGTAAAEDERFLLDFENEVNPSENKALMGLYKCAAMHAAVVSCAHTLQLQRLSHHAVRG
jgi:hypothetical protein